MPLSEHEEAQVFRYLLGLGSDAERAGVEERLFSDAWAQDIQAAEMELIRDYVRGRLAPDVRRSFEIHYFSTPALRSKVEREMLLVEKLSPSFSARLRRAFALAGRSVVPGYATAFASLCVAAWLIAENANLRNELGRVRETATAAAQRTPSFAAFVLTPGTLRGESGGQHRLYLPSDIAEVHLNLDFPKASAATPYKAVLQAVGGGEVGDVRAVVIEPGRLAVTFSAASMTTGDYVLRLEAGRAGGSFVAVETYSFGIVRP